MTWIVELRAVDKKSVLTEMHCYQCRGPTEKCRFMDKRVCEILRFLVAPRLELTPAVWRVSRTLLSRNTSTSVHREAWLRRGLFQQNAEIYLGEIALF